MFHVEHPTGFSVEIGLEFPIYGDGDGWKRGHFPPVAVWTVVIFADCSFLRKSLGLRGFRRYPVNSKKTVSTGLSRSPQSVRYALASGFR
jgi:hypothetical protein